MRKVMVFLVAGLVFFGSVAYATIPDSSGVIHGCYKTSNLGKGALIVVDSDVESCPNGFTSLDWNQTGPVGPTGATGATGPTGPPGPNQPPQHIVQIFASKQVAGPGNSEPLTAYCRTNLGEFPLGGGFRIDPVDATPENYDNVRTKVHVYLVEAVPDGTSVATWGEEGVVPYILTVNTRCGRYD